MTVARFAPSQAGHLHLGHAFAAFNAWTQARASGGRFLLRMENIDPGRCAPASAVHNSPPGSQGDPEWLGLHWGGPVRAIKHLPEFQLVLDGLATQGLVVSLRLHPG